MNDERNLTLPPKVTYDESGVDDPKVWLTRIMDGLDEIKVKTVT